MKTLSLTGLLTLTLFAGSAAADPENYIKYRQAMMKAIGGHMGASTDIVRGKVDPEGDLKMHATALAALNANLARLFPEGSDFGDTKAKPAVWDEPDKFRQAADAARDATAAFAAAVESGDSAAIAAAHKDVGQSCKGCHEDFRQKDD
ncbi:MAG: cytochrome c [Gammaproteobacteria bacterium]|nr:cytochrome c [Gammaproteobacteria bacterium]